MQEGHSACWHLWAATHPSRELLENRLFPRGMSVLIHWRARGWVWDTVWMCEHSGVWGMEPDSPVGERMEFGSHTASCQGLLILWPPGGPALTPGSGTAGSLRCLMNWTVLEQKRWMRTATLVELQDHFCALVYGREKSSSSLWRLSLEKDLG